MDSPLDLKAHLQDPRMIKTTRDFAAAFEAAIAANNEALTDYLLNNFRVGDHEVLFIGSSAFHTGEPTTGKTT